MTKTLSALFAAVALSFATSALAAAPAGPVVLQAKPGNVSFDHAKHAAVACTKCHATDKGGAIEGFAKAGSADAPNKDKAHAACQGCHKEQGKGPQKCADCHKKA